MLDENRRTREATTNNEGEVRGKEATTRNNE